MRLRSLRIELQYDYLGVTMKKLILIVSVFSFLLTITTFTHAIDTIPSEVTLYKNVNIFDGTSDQLKEGYDVLVVRNKIHKIGQDIPTSGTYEIDVQQKSVKEVSVYIPMDRTYSVTVFDKEGKTEKKNVSVNVIDGGGRTLMPGIIEAHNHLMLSMPNTAWFNTHDITYIAAAGAEEARRFLMRGWTTVRDIGGPAMGSPSSISFHLLRTALQRCSGQSAKRSDEGRSR
jgi:imidazolonepropionase-like amidohydrolase